MATATRVVPVPTTAARPSGPEVRAADAVLPGTRWLLRTFVALTSLAVADLLVFAARAHQDFAWSIHMEITAAFLGAAYAAGWLLSLLALRRGTWTEVRIPVVTVAVFTSVSLTATLVHAHRLHLLDGGPVGRFAAWLWLAVYLVVPVASLAVIGRQERAGRAPAPAVRRPMPRWLAVALAAQGGVLFVAGVVLFAGGLTVHHHAEPMTHFWPWDMMPLSTEVTGAWLISFGVAAALVIRERDLRRLVAPAAAYTAFGVLELLVLVRYRAQIDAGDPWLWGYATLLLTIVLTGGYGWWAARSAARWEPRSGSVRARDLRGRVAGG